MIYLTATLIAVGAILAALGTAGFRAVAMTAPDWNDLLIARKTATIGRWATSAGLLLLATGHHAVGGVALLAVCAAIVAAVASILTKARIQDAARGAAA